MTGQAQLPADRFVDAVLTASRVLVAVSARSLADVEDSVTVVQFRTLVVLRTRQGTNLNRLAESLGVTPSTALRMVDRLESAGFVERRPHPDNRRERQLVLTRAGRHLVDSVTARRRAEIARIVEAMPERRRGDLARAFESFAEAAGEPIATGGVTAYGW